MRTRHRVFAGDLRGIATDRLLARSELHSSAPDLRVSSLLPELPSAANVGMPEPIARAAEEGHNPIFDALVTREGEIAGLVAYSIYKQNKRAWLDDFAKATSRPPTEDESRAYLIGESTQRRLATYRHLAAATLAGEDTPRQINHIGASPLPDI